MSSIRMPARVVTAMFLAVAAFSASFAVPTLPAGAESEPAATDDEAEGFAEGVGVSLEEARAYMALDPYVEDVVLQARKAHGSSFAGVWRDPLDGEGGRLHIAFTSHAAERAAEATAGYPDAQRVVVHTVDHSQSELDAVQELIANQLPTLVGQGHEVLSVGIDDRVNRVRIDIHEGAPSDAEERLRKVLPAGDFLLFDRTGPIRLAACDTRRSCAGTPLSPIPIRGGIELGNYALFRCTSAFAATGPAPAPANDVRVLTAAHCFPGTDQVFHQPNGVVYPIGRVAQRRFGGNVDAESITVDVSLWSNRGNYVYRTNTSKSYPISAVKNHALDSAGQSVCSLGITTNQQCSTITRRSVALTVDGTLFTDIVEASTCALPGDSGGAVVASNTAQGIVNFSNFTYNQDDDPVCRNAANRRMYYSAAQNVQTQLGVRIKTAY